MSKLVAFLVAAAGASTVSVGGTFLLKKGGGTGSEGNTTGQAQNQQNTSTPEQLTLYETVEKFKTPKGDSCVHELFGSDLDMSGASSSTLPADSANYFGNNPTEEATDKKTEGCLIINWKKDEYGSDNDKKWKGTFTWSWSFKNQKKGFIIFGVAKNNTEGKKMDVNGVTYFLDEDTTQSAKGKISYYKEVTNGKEITKDTSDIENKLLKAHTNIHGGLPETNKNYGGFISGKDDLDKICGTSDCSGSDNTSPSQAYKWKGNWQKEGVGHKIGEWSSSLDWWKQIFDENAFDLSGKLTNFTGTGTLQQVVPAK